ncbi:MAG TPA: hypothetical protein VG537_07625 [Candidatus Kapabacteria bacterium]|jgi:hypothetical protein|nr:hypothetical protein [Candidatus Kapabacteria bacterium]
MILTIAFAAMLGGSPNMTHASLTSSPAIASSTIASSPIASQTLKISHHEMLVPKSAPMGFELHSMTTEEQKLFPGRERFDKTEWYESQFKSAKIVLQPEHVDEWHNGGLDAA